MILLDSRSSGIVMHISSLPGKYGIGDFGQEAYDFVDYLVKAKQKNWQILPLGITSFGDSPYQSFSAFAGNPYFIDLDEMLEKQFISQKDLIKYKLDIELSISSPASFFIIVGTGFINQLFIKLLA